MSKWLYLLSFIFLLSGCNFSYDCAPKRKINIQELLGSWEQLSYSGEAIKDVETNQEYDGYNRSFIITLKANQTYHLKLISENSTVLPTSVGKWSLSDDAYYEGRHHYRITLEKPRYISMADYSFFEKIPLTSSFEVNEDEKGSLYLCVDSVDSSVCFNRKTDEK